MKMSFDIEIPSSVDVKQSYVIIVNHQHALDAYLFNQVKSLLNPLKYYFLASVQEFKSNTLG